VAAAGAWFEALEAAGRDAVAGDPEIEGWLGRVAGLALSLPVALMTPGCAHVPLPDDGALEPAILPALAGLGAERAVMLWSQGSPFVHACALVGAALPEGRWFARLLAEPVAPVEGGA
jgi:hypothetical protein